MLATILAAGLIQSQAVTDLENHLEVALGGAGLTSQTARFNSELLRLYGQPTDLRSPLFSLMHSNPWKIPYFAETLRREVAAAAGQPNAMLMALGRLTNYGTRRTLIGSPIKYAEDAAAAPGGLSTVLADMKTAGLIKGELPALTSVPSDVQKAATLMLSTLHRSVKYRRLAIKDIGAIDETYLFLAANAATELDGEPQDRLMRIGRSLDLSYMGAAAHDVFLAASTAAPMAAKVPATAKYSFEVETAWGSIRLTGGGDTTHPDKPLLLAIDTGGNDTYLNGPSTASPSNWSSTVIDTAGSDKYLSDAGLAQTEIAKWDGRRLGAAKPGPGGALLGVTTLYDLSGDDLYRTHRSGLGAGRFGFAALVDQDGADRYDAYNGALGFGDYGIGLAFDGAGNDRYACFGTSQGCALIRAAGVLLDQSGDDVYIANDTVIDAPSAQSDKHNMSMSQGAATGRRADYTDGHNLAGGLGILYDQAGSDQYTCGIFGQGVGYWEGVGMLWDDAGVDSYTGQWYVQGASAHFAIGYLEDSSGNDSYNAPMNMAQGAGHDYSIGWLLDRAGDDTYKAPNLSLGGGNANGIGAFADLLGNDKYDCSGLTLGKASEADKTALRGRALCLGVFLDVVGDDLYPTAISWAGNARRSVNWTAKGTYPFESQLGIYVDR